MRKPERQKTNMLGVVIPGAMTPFDKAAVGGISKGAKEAKCDCSLLISKRSADKVIAGAFKCQTNLCLAERVAGVFLRPLRGRASHKAMAQVLSGFRKEKVPVVLFDDAAIKLPKTKGCDRISLKCKSAVIPEAAVRLGDVAFRLMAQRLADPSLPPVEVQLNVP